LVNYQIKILELGLDDYPKIIKNPMDVSTIKVKKIFSYLTIQIHILKFFPLINYQFKLEKFEKQQIYKHL